MSAILLHAYVQREMDWADFSHTERARVRSQVRLCGRQFPMPVGAAHSALYVLDTELSVHEYRHSLLMASVRWEPAALIAETFVLLEIVPDLAQQLHEEPIGPCRHETTHGRGRQEVGAGRRSPHSKTMRLSDVTPLVGKCSYSEKHAECSEGLLINPPVARYWYHEIGVDLLGN